MLSGDVGRVSVEFLRGYLSAVYGCVCCEGFGAPEGANACLGLVCLCSRSRGKLHHFSVEQDYAGEAS